MTGKKEGLRGTGNGKGKNLGGEGRGGRKGFGTKNRKKSGSGHCEGLRRRMVVCRSGPVFKTMI